MGNGAERHASPFSLCLSASHLASLFWAGASRLPFLVSLVFRLVFRSRHRRQKPTGDKLSHLCCWHAGFENRRMQRMFRSTSGECQWFANEYEDSVFISGPLTCPKVAVHGLVSDT